MNTTLRKATLVVAVAAMLAALPATANAYHRHHHRHHGGAGWVLPLAAAALVTGAVLSAPRYNYGYGYPSYYAPPPPPRPVYRPACQPVTVQRYNYWRQPVLVTATQCWDPYGRPYLIN